MSLARPRSGSWVLALALVSTVTAVISPEIPWHRNIYRYVFVLDITQSMNARDYSVVGLPPDRLSFAKTSLRKAVPQLPCGSQVGIAVFTTKDSLVLLEPLETCGGFSVIDKVLSRLDWRMAWSADSNIERGLYSALLLLKKMDPVPRLVFLTDGEQTVKELHRPPLARHAGSVDGFLIGVGGTTVPVPVPRLNERNQLDGYWTNEEVDRFDLETAETAADKGDADSHYLSRLQESGLIELANRTGLEYRRLQSTQQFSDLLHSEHLGQSAAVRLNAGAPFAGIAWLLVCLIYLRRFVETAMKRRNSRA